MKTLEEKARAYDEALERAQKVHRYSSDLAEIKRMEDIFPELAMSEDERIKKEFCKDIWTFIPNERAHKYIAWLEKQGQCQVKESAISQHENKTCKENNDSLTSKDDMMIEETLYFLREYQQSNRCKDESGMQNSVSCEKWLKALKGRIGG